MAREPTKGDRTRAEILAAAAHDMREQGYEAATLEGIASHVGLTRSAVLHHFGTKREVLNEVVRPVLAELDAFLDRIESEGKSLPRHRREHVTELVDLAAAHRDAVVILVRDNSALAHLDPDNRPEARQLRLASVMSAAHDDGLALVRALAAFGCLVRPLGAPDDLVDFDDLPTRRLIVDAMLAALRVPLPAEADR